MGVIKTILLVLFVIISILLILLVLVQNDNSTGMGTAFGGGQSAAFGSHSASVLTKTTGVFVALFLIAVFLLAFLNRGSLGDNGLSGTAAQVQGDAAAGARGGSWVDEDAAGSLLPPDGASFLDGAVDEAAGADGDIVYDTLPSDGR